MYQHYVAIGRLTKDPLIKYTQTGTPVLNFVLAINRSSGNEADFIPCVIWKEEAKKMSDELGKGSLIQVDGVFKSRMKEDDLKVQLEVQSYNALEKRPIGQKNGKDEKA